MFCVTCSTCILLKMNEYDIFVWWVCSKFEVFDYTEMSCSQGKVSGRTVHAESCLQWCQDHLLIGKCVCAHLVNALRIQPHVFQSCALTNISLVSHWYRSLSTATADVTFVSTLHGWHQDTNHREWQLQDRRHTLWDDTDNMQTH